MTLAQLIEAQHPATVAVRHDLHRHPELGYKELRTSEVVCRTLDEIGVQYVKGLAKGTGVLGFLPATQDGGKTVALRADMDALPIAEATGLPYASTTSGVMHACGHDGHTSGLLGVARALAATEVRRNNVLFVFQPAEEGGAGGEAMCQDGVLRGKVLGPPADVMYGLHGFPDLELGRVATKVGPMMAAATEFRMTIRGQGGHAAYPHWGVDPIVAASQVILGLQTVASRNVSPLDSVVVTVGEVKAGFAHNVIPNTAELRGTLRTLRDETEVLAKRRIEEIATGIAAAMGATAEVQWVGSYPVVVNDPLATDRFWQVASKIDGITVEECPEPSMGGEDFAFYGREVPACFFLVGLRPMGQDGYPGLHTPNFDFNDDALPIAVRTMSELALAPVSL